MQVCLALVGLLWFGAVVVLADTHYVRPYNEGQANPYTSWETAGTNIIDVVNAAMTNITTPRIVWVSNSVSGGYVLTNQIRITNALILQSTNGPDVTVINGNFTPGSPETNRCLLMSNALAFVSGLTFSNGAVINENGGGVWMYGGILSNCMVRNNTLFVPDSTVWRGGGIYSYDGTITLCQVIGNLVTNLNSSGRSRGGGMGSYGTYINSCLISNNSIVAGNASDTGGGGVYISSGTSAGRIYSSMICNNSFSGIGALSIYDNGIAKDCTVTVNAASYIAGGCELCYGTITNCVISYNRSISYAGALYMRPNQSQMSNYVYNTTIVGNTNGGVIIGYSVGKNYVINCVIRDNTSNAVSMLGTNDYLFNSVVSGNRGLGVRYLNGTIRNCLIAGNSNNGTGGGLLIPSACQTALVSCCTIVSNQSAYAGSGLRIEATNAPSARLISISSCIIYSNGVSGTDDVYDVCAPTNIGALQYSCIGTNPGFTGAGIIVANPQFKDFAGGNYRLAANSPCINTGSNENWMTNSYDLDVRTRIRYGTVDMGAYERINEGTIYKLW